MTEKIKAIYNIIKYEMFIFSFLLIELVLKIPGIDHLNPWVTTSYAMTYDLGFSSRLLMGSLIKVVVPFLSVQILYGIILMSLILLSGFTAVLIGRVIRTADIGAKNLVIVLAILFLASPGSVSFLFGWTNFGRFDTYLILLTLLCIAIMANPKRSFLVPFICILAVAIHQVFIFTYFPIILAIMLYEIYESKWNKSRAMEAAITIVGTCSLFFYFQFASRLRLNDPEGVADFIRARSDIPIDTKMIDAEFFQDASYHIRTFVMPTMEELMARLATAGLTLLLLLPLILFIAWLWRDIFKNTKDPTQCLILKMMLTMQIAILPAFILTTDYGRWFAALLIGQFCLLFYLIFRNNQAMLISAAKISGVIDRNSGVFMAFALYLCVLGKFEADHILELPRRLLKVILIMGDKLFG